VSSNINYLSINENFPVARQDNDTQVFRDNFDTIKTSLRNAKDEITVLQDTTAKTDNDNDFNLNVINNAVLQRVRDQKLDDGAPETATYTVDWQQGSFHILRVTRVGGLTINLANLPGDPAYTGEASPVGFGRMTLELYGNTTLTFSTTGGTIVKSNGFPGHTSGFPVISLSSLTNPVYIDVWRHNDSVIYMRYLGLFQ
jgi:hypothetical protein